MKEKVLILNIGRCAWGRCIFCGYSRENYPEPNLLRMKVDLDRKLVGFEGDTLKIFGSGSFLDDKQFPREFRRYLVEKCKKKGIKHLTIESRPEFITEDTLLDFDGIDLTVAIGLEVADNDILKKLGKGMTVEDYTRAADIIHSKGFKVRTYLLVNPPFVDDIKESLDRSVSFALQHSDSIVLINLLPHANAPLFDLWVEGKWKPLTREKFFEITRPYANNPKIELDVETFRFVPRFPPEKRANLEGVSSEILNHPHFRVWQEYLCDWYEKPKDKTIALFLPCSAKKPYSKSKTHTLIYKTIKTLPIFKNIHRLVISTPGVVPFEFNDFYPFNAYEWDERLETPEIKKEYIKVTKKRIFDYLKHHKYDHYFCFFKYSAESYIALQEACNELGVSCTNCLSRETYEALKEEKGNPLFKEEALKELREALSKVK